MSALAMPMPTQPAEAVVLQTEKPSSFHQILSDLQAEYNPQSTIEQQLCRQIAESYWRLQRTTQLETDLFNSNSDFTQIADALLKLSRYRASIEREWHKSIDQLLKIQTLRSKAEAQPQPKPKKHSPLDDLLKRYLFAPPPGEAASEPAADDIDEDETD